MDTLTPREPTVPAADPAPQPTSLWEDLVDVFVAPFDLFARRSDGRYAGALVVLTLVSAFLFYGVMQTLGPAFEAEFERGIREAGEGAPPLSAEQVEQMRSMGGVFAVLGLLISTPVAAFVVGGAIWLLVKVLGSGVSYRVGVAIATFSSFPVVLSMLAMLVQGMLLTPESLSAVSMGPARFFDPESTPAAVMALLGRLDLFVLWSAALTAVGMNVAGRLPVPQAIAGAVAVWLLASLPELIAAIV